MSRLGDATTGDTSSTSTRRRSAASGHLRHQVIGYSALSPDASPLGVVDAGGTVHAIHTRSGERRLVARTRDGIPPNTDVRVP